jgi:hypothetical protein
MRSFFSFKRTQSKRKSTYVKPKPKQLDIESLEQRTGPTETIGVGLTIYGLLHLNPRAGGAHADSSSVGRTTGQSYLTTPTERLSAIQLPDGFPNGIFHAYVPPPPPIRTEEISVAQSTSSDFRRTDFQSVPLFKLDLIDDQNLRSGGGGGELKNGPLGGGGGDNSHGAAPNTNTGPGAGSGAPAAG